MTRDVSRLTIISKEYQRKYKVHKVKMLQVDVLQEINIVIVVIMSIGSLSWNFDLLS